MAGSPNGYLVFDIESVADIDLIAKVRHPEGDVTPEEALRLFQQEQMEKKGTEFIPFTYQVPISLVIARVNSNYEFTGIKCLAWENGGPKRIAEDFWNYWRQCGKPTFVTFNGRGFDIPMMEMMAFRYGIPVPEWFGPTGNYTPRNRYNQTAHFDLFEYLSNFGSAQLNGGLNLSAKVLRKPGKIETHGDMVQNMFDQGEFKDIHAYCFCDVLDTYFVFLRCKVLAGEITPQQEADLVQRVRNYITGRADKSPVSRLYVEAWEKAETSLTVDERFARKLKLAQAASEPPVEPAEPAESAEPAPEEEPAAEPVPEPEQAPEIPESPSGPGADDPPF